MKPSQIWSFIANEGKELLSRPISPVRELIAVFVIELAGTRVRTFR